MTNGLDTIVARWKIPQKYLEYLQNNPETIDIESELFVNWLRLYGAKDLVKSQEGYSYNPIKNEIIKEWPSEMLVIGDDGADPYVLDLSKSDGNDAPILVALHGGGSWKFTSFAESFEEFLEKVGFKK